MRTSWRIVLLIVAVTAAGVLAIGTALGHGKPRQTAKTWTTVFASPISVEGLTLDDDGNLYVPQRGGAAGCAIVRVDAEGGAAQAGTVAQRRAARVPDEPGDRGPAVLHHELGRKPPRQLAEQRRRSTSGQRRRGQGLLPRPAAEVARREAAGRLADNGGAPACATARHRFAE